MANNATYPLGPIAPSVRQNATIVTAGTLTYNPPLTKLYVGGAGNITMAMTQTGTVTLTSVPAGSFVNDVAIVSIGTMTATNVIGFF